MSGKRIGSFINPATGEEDWLEPNTVQMVSLDPRSVIKVGDTVETTIDFKLKAIKNETVIALTSEYTCNGTKYVSDDIEMNVEEFASQFASIVYSDRSLDEAEIVKAAKDEAIKNLTGKLIENSILLGEMQFRGLGFVVVENDKVMTIEEIDFEHKVINSRSIKTATLKNCVSQASLTNLDNPTIEFYNGIYKVVFIRPKVIESQEGRLKNYKVEVDDIIIDSNVSSPEYTVFKNPDFNNDDFIDEMILERKKLLDDCLSNDDELEDMLGELFN